jgi:hypothetical protein
MADSANLPSIGKTSRLRRIISRVACPASSGSKLHPIAGIAAIDTSFAYGIVKRSTVFPRVKRSG